MNALAVSTPKHRQERPQSGGRYPALAAIVLAMGLAFLVNAAIPAVSALTAAVGLGIGIGSTPLLGAPTRKAVAAVTKRMLRAGVVLLGLQLALPAVLGLGAGTLLAVLVTVATTFGGTLLLARLIGVPSGLGLLVATGFAICGASAIAAMEGVTERKDSDVATAVALVTCYGGVAIVAVPVIGGWLGLTGPALGGWAGLSVHEVAQVVAAATPAGAAAVNVAVVVKLSRVVLLAPMVAAVSVHARLRRPDGVEGRRVPLVPLFVIGFLAMVLVRSTGVVPMPVLDVAHVLTTLLLAGALFGLGCAVRVAQLVRTGGRALLLGLASTLLVGSVGYLTLTSFGQP
jgi:uncharacterized integral membrane protein (TIGR00698 family)